MNSQAAKEEHTVGEYPGGNASAMWKTGALKAVATARSSTAARTAGLREVTNKKQVASSVSMNTPNSHAS